MGLGWDAGTRNGGRCVEYGFHKDDFAGAPSCRTTLLGKSSLLPPIHQLIPRADNDRTRRIHLQGLPFRLVRNLRRMLLHRLPDPRCASRPPHRRPKKSRHREWKRRGMDVRGKLQVSSWGAAGPVSGLVEDARERASGMEEGRTVGPVDEGTVGGFIGLPAAHEVALGDRGAGGSRTYDLCLGGRVDELFDRVGVSV